MAYEIKCATCGQPTQNKLDFKCPRCGNPLEVCLSVDFEKAKIHRKSHIVWRYRKFLPYTEEKDIITLGEGHTPLVKLEDNVLLKLESLNPTGSFKDRGSTVLVSAIQRLVKTKKGFISEDSSGNAGASIAAYATRAGLTARIYVPENVSGPKLTQTRFYGAEVVKIAGSRSKVAEEAQKPEKGKFYVGHILHPLFRDGIRTLAYEITEELSWQSPQHLFLPVSAGTLLLGVISGFKHLLDSNIMDTIPRIIACQTRQVSPLYHRFKNLTYKPPVKITSVADALVSSSPPLLDLMVKHLRNAEGDAVMVEEDETRRAFKHLARRGFFVEPSSAVAFAGYKKQVEEGDLSTSEDVVIVLTGTGLKTSLRPD
jgi:threonine synthase